jgi:glycosyltransferase involved in cell wall biosynthesis
MSISQHSDADRIQSDLTVLGRRLFCSDPDIENLRTYYNAAKEAGKLYQAKQTLEALQKRHPGDHNIRSLFIAACLEQKELPAAMEAIETLVAFSKPGDGLIESSLSVRNRIGPRGINQVNTNAPTLSVCMVVKNEQVTLGPCLNAVKSIADEIIVVDTGSTDRTPDIAGIFGARVFSFDWKDDFSAARNYSLEKATGDWILILDADEIIAREDLIHAKHAIQSCKNRPTAFSMETRNYTHVANAFGWQANDGRYPLQEAGLGWFPSLKIRLFPRLPNINFSFPVHELVEPSVRAAGLQIVRSEIPIHHYGHLNESKNKRKARAYFNIGYAKLDQLGNDYSALRELAVQAGQLEHWPEASELWHRLILIKPEFTEAYVNLAGISWQTKAYRQAIKFAQQALQFDPLSKEAHYNMAISRLMLGQADEAKAILSRLMARDEGYLSAKFMQAVVGCILEDRSCERDFKELSRSPAGPALKLAVQDMIRRFQSANLDCYAALLTQSAVFL